MSDEQHPEVNPEINIEEIMQQIRAQIVAQRQATSDPTSPPIQVAGKRLPPDFYDHLYQAWLTHNDIGVKMLVTPSRLPLIGRLLDWARGQIHQLVLFYLDQVVAKQRTVNTHLFQAINILGETLEAEGEPDAPPPAD